MNHNDFSSPKNSLAFDKTKFRDMLEKDQCVLPNINQGNERNHH